MEEAEKRKLLTHLLIMGSITIIALSLFNLWWAGNRVATQSEMCNKGLLDKITCLILDLKKRCPDAKITGWMHLPCDNASDSPTSPDMACWGLKFESKICPIPDGLPLINEKEQHPEKIWNGTYEIYGKCYKERINGRYVAKEILMEVPCGA